MTFYFIYAGKKGSGLDSTLSLYEVAKELNADVQLILSRDNYRYDKLTKFYPEAKFYNFFSPSDALKLKKEIGKGTAFFTMISPKIVPLFLALNTKKIFYFHATYDYSFGRKKFADHVFDVLHDVVIKNSTMTLTTQFPLAWQIRFRLGKKAEELPHPPFSVLPDGFYAEDEEVELPFQKYFLTYGGLDRTSKGLDVLLEGIKDTNLNTVLAGKNNRVLNWKNISNLNRWISDGELHNLIKKSECVVLPYLVPSQFSGCMALSFYFGKPVLAPFSPTFEHWIEEDKTGWFFSSGNYYDLREKMNEIWSGNKSYSEAAIRKKEHEMKEKTRKKLKELLED